MNPPHLIYVFLAKEELMKRIENVNVKNRQNSVLNGETKYSFGCAENEREGEKNLKAIYKHTHTHTHTYTHTRITLMHTRTHKLILPFPNIILHV